MLQSERHEQILNLLSTQRFLKVKELERQFGISRSTAIRDIELLAQSGQANRTYGGIKHLDSPRKPALQCQFYSRLANGNTFNAKEKIVAKAASIIESGATLFIDGGTTTQQLCTHLTELDLRIITNSLRIACFFSENSTNDVLLTGGLLHRRGHIMIGPHALNMLDTIHADWFVASAGGIDAEGLTNTDLLTVEIEKKMIERSSRVMILADHTKFGRKALTYFISFDQVDVLVTDELPDSTIRQALEGANTELIIA